MAAEFTRADALREYLSGAASDGATQADPDLSLGNYRSSTEAASLGIQVSGLMTGVTPLYAGGANPTGAGLLTAANDHTLTWRPAGAASAGPQAVFPAGTSTRVVEANGSFGQYLRVRGVTPFTTGTATVTLVDLFNNFFGFDNVSVAQAAAGLNQYRATVIKNESAGLVLDLRRWLGLLGTTQTSNVAQLGGGGAGSIVTGGDFSDWPTQGYAQVRRSSGLLREVVYYTARTSNVLNVPASGRGLLGTAAAAGAGSDLVYAVPGVAIGLDPAGVYAGGGPIQAVANQATTPAGVSWVLGVDQAGALAVGSIPSGSQAGLWVWRQIPAGASATGLARNLFRDSFNAF